MAVHTQIPLALFAARIGAIEDAVMLFFQMRYTFTKTCTIFETLTTKSPILVQKKMTTKIHPSTTVIKNPSKKQHVKKLCPQK